MDPAGERTAAGCQVPIGVSVTSRAGSATKRLSRNRPSRWASSSSERPRVSNPAIDDCTRLRARKSSSAPDQGTGIQLVDYALERPPFQSSDSRRTTAQSSKPHSTGPSRPPHPARLHQTVNAARLNERPRNALGGVTRTSVCGQLLCKRPSSVQQFSKATRPDVCSNNLLVLVDPLPQRRQQSDPVRAQ